MSVNENIPDISVPEHPFWGRLRDYCQQRVGTRVRFISGMPAIRRKFADLEQLQCEEQLRLVPHFGPAGVPRGSVLPSTTTRVRSIVSPEMLSGHSLEHLDHLTEHGWQIRSSTAAERKLVVVNRSVALIDISGTEQFRDPEGVWISDPDVLRPVIKHFEKLWHLSTPLVAPTKQQPTPKESRFTPRQVRVLELLSEGLTDDQISRELSVSSRSIRSEVAAIRKVLGAQSRFQAGLRYAQLKASE